MRIRGFLKKQNRTFLSWLISYMIVLIIPIIIGSFAYYTSVETVSGEINHVHDASLKQFSVFMDGKIEETSRICKEIIADSTVNAIMSEEPPIRHPVSYAVLDIQNHLKELETYNSYIERIYIYFRNDGYLLTSSSLYRQKSISRLAEESFGMDDTELSKLIDSARLFDIKLSRKATDDGKPVNKIICTQGVFSNYAQKPAATVLVVLDQEKLDAAITSLNWTTLGMVLMANSRDEFISTGTENLLPDFLRYNYLQRMNSSYYSKYEDIEMIVNHIHSDVSDLEYASLIPSKTYLQKVQYIKTIVIAYILLCLVIGILTAYLIAKKNYNPLKKLTHMIATNTGKPAHAEHNDFRFLEDSMIDLMNEKEYAKKRLKQQAEVMRDNSILRLVKGRISNIKTLQESLDANGIHFKSNRFLVMIYNIEDYGDYLSAGESEEKTFEFANFIIRNVVEELTGEHHIGYMTEIGGMMVCLVNILPQGEDGIDPETVINEMIHIGIKSREVINKNFKVNLAVSISDLQDSLEGIEKAYSQAVEAMEYRALVCDAKNVICYSELNSSESSVFDYKPTLEKEKKFINFIMSGDYKNAGITLDDIITNDFPESYTSLQLVKYRMFGLVNSMLNAIGEIRPTMDVKFFEELDPVNRLLKAKSVTELQSQAKVIFKRVNEYYESRTGGLLQDKADELVNYVRDNCLKPTISIAELSDTFQMSQAYISRLFKKKTGMGLVDYIHDLRLEKAKELMKNPELSIKDISEQVGFHTTTTLTRAFRKSEGIAPGKYRDMD